MKWVIRQAGCFWSKILEDCFEYYKGCQDCQRFGNIQRVPASALNPIIKPWPFRGWGIDLIGQINPPSSKGHKFVLLATDYFTKWVEAIPLKKVTSENMVEFVKEHIIYRFGIPQTITTDQGAQFVSLEFREFAESMGIKLFNSSPYYAQANGQAEASNKIMIKLIQEEDRKLKQRRGIDDHCLRHALALLPSASSEARRRLRRRTMLVWDVHCLERGATKIGKDSRAKRLGGELGAPTVAFIGLAR
jgi:hypothetical protein